ncbi:MAG: hypothetical protein ACRDK1_10280 [Solirubrobacterales bacterium]
MRFKRRSAAIIALAVAGALSVAGIALAATSSTVSFKFTPGKVSKTTPKAGQINVHTHTNYADTSTNYTNRAQLYFDSDFAFNTGAVPKCNKTSISGTKTMAQAMAACGSKLIGKGTATAAAGANTVQACVLAFNGTGSGNGHVLLFTRANVAPPFTMNCANPTSNTAGNTNVLLDGQLGPANKPGYGKLLDFNNIHAASALPLTDFNVTIGKPTVPATGNYVAAKCSHSPKTWKVQTKFTYDSGSPQTVNSTQACTN